MLKIPKMYCCCLCFRPFCDDLPQERLLEQQLLGFRSLSAMKEADCFGSCLSLQYRSQGGHVRRICIWFPHHQPIRISQDFRTHRVNVPVIRFDKALFRGSRSNLKPQISNRTFYLWEMTFPHLNVKFYQSKVFKLLQNEHTNKTDTNKIHRKIICLTINVKLKTLHYYISMCRKIKTFS